MSDKLKTRILLLLMNMSSIWLISLMLWFVTGFGILMSMLGSVNSMHYQLFVPSAFCLFMCVRDYQQMKRKYGGTSFFDTLMRRSVKKMEEAYLRTAEHYNRENPDMSSVLKKIAEEDNPEARARKVAEKGLKTGDHKKAMDLIISNRKEEPKSAEAVMSALK